MQVRWFALLSCAIAGTAGAADVYRWVDQNGVVNYSDQMPVGDIRGLEEKQLFANVIDDQPSYALKRAAQRHPVVLFGGDCGPLCRDAQALLEKRGIPYTLKDPQKNRSDANELNRLTGGMQVPVLRVGDKVYKGFEAEMWNDALDSADYPRTPLPHHEAPPAPPVSASTPPAGDVQPEPPAAH